MYVHEKNRTARTQSAGMGSYSPMYIMYTITALNHYNLDRFLISLKPAMGLNITDFKVTNLRGHRRTSWEGSANTICYWSEFPKSRWTAAWTFPDVAISALMFSWVSKNPISWSCESWVAYNCSGGSETTTKSMSSIKSRLNSYSYVVPIFLDYSLDTYKYWKFIIGSRVWKLSDWVKIYTGESNHSL